MNVYVWRGYVCVCVWQYDVSKYVTVCVFCILSNIVKVVSAVIGLKTVAGTT